MADYIRKVKLEDLDMEDQYKCSAPEGSIMQVDYDGTAKWIDPTDYNNAINKKLEEKQRDLEQAGREIAEQKTNEIFDRRVVDIEKKLEAMYSEQSASDRVEPINILRRKVTAWLKT